MSRDGDALVDALRSYGVRYLSGGHASTTTAPPEPAALMTALAESPEPLLRHALAALLLVHPELAPEAERVADALPSPGREALIEAYIAAVYLRTLWRTRLRRHLGDQPALPPLWIEGLGLPAPTELDGRLGLAALDARRRGSARLRPGLSEYEQVARHLFGQFVTERAAAA